MAEQAIAVTPKTIVGSGVAKFAELSGKVELGEQSAGALGVPVGTVVDLGVLASTEPAPTLSRWQRLARFFVPPIPDPGVELAVRYQEYAAGEVAKAAA